MFKNVGKKIQGYSETVFAVDVISSVLLGILAYILLNRIIGENAGFVAVIVVLYGIFRAWTRQLRLFAFGKIAESCELMQKSMERMEAMERNRLPGRRCNRCGMMLDNDAAFCPNCGERISL